eukprot:scaffold25747_cov50-Attheya_sp.AAC.3
MKYYVARVIYHCYHVQCGLRASRHKTASGLRGKTESRGDETSSYGAPYTWLSSLPAAVNDTIQCKVQRNNAGTNAAED